MWVLDPASMTLRPQPVEVVTADGNEAIISSGWKPGMLVAVAGVHAWDAIVESAVRSLRPMSRRPQQPGWP